MTFQGYTQETVDFLWGIRFNNERGWFMDHKQDYQNHLLSPTRALAEQVYDAIHEGFPDEPFLLKMSRIYRDARRLHGRGPYKDRLWWSMERPSDNWSGEPVFWFELEPEGYSYGMGFWMAPAVTMAKFRARMDQDPKPMEQLARAFRRQDRFVLDGVDYKRPKGEAAKLLAPWYNKKSFSLGYEGPHDALLWSHDLADQLLEGYEFLLPYYQYMMDVIADPDPREQ